MEDSVWGHCHRYPPKEILIKRFPKLKYEMQLPEVLMDEDWCGEHTKYKKYEN